jgi:cytochrome c biogenesis protein CcdA
VAVTRERASTAMLLTGALAIMFGASVKQGWAGWFTWLGLVLLVAAAIVFFLPRIPPVRKRSDG